MLKTTNTIIKTPDMFLIHTESRRGDEMRSGGEEMRSGGEEITEGGFYSSGEGFIAQNIRWNCRRNI
jgi:hypothetical protein